MANAERISIKTTPKAAKLIPIFASVLRDAFELLVFAGGGGVLVLLDGLVLFDELVLLDGAVVTTVDEKADVRLSKFNVEPEAMAGTPSKESVVVLVKFSTWAKTTFLIDGEHDVRPRNVAKAKAASDWN